MRDILFILLFIKRKQYNKNYINDKKWLTTIH